MTECPKVEHLLVLPRLRVQNANALSSPQTHGFPAMSAFLGLMWALQRKTSAAGIDLRFQAVGVVCHGHQELVADSGFVKRVIPPRPPLTTREDRKKLKADGSFKPASFIEEGRIHLELSLVLAVRSEQLAATTLGDGNAADTIALQVRELLDSLRIAGGSLVPSSAPASRQKPFVVHLTGNPQDREDSFQRLRLRLLPGFALVGRDDLLEQRHQALLADNSQASRLDAWLSLSRINWRYRPESDDGEPGWEHDRQQLGWVVPIPVGYATLSGPHAPGSVANARDPRIPFSFVESLYSLGEWLSPHRLHSPQQLLWYAEHDAASGRYRCRNDYAAPAATDYDFD